MTGQPLSVKLRPANEDDLRLMAIIRLSNDSTFARIANDMENPDSETSIKNHESDIRTRLADLNGLLTVAIVELDGSDVEHIAGWANWKVFDVPQPLEAIPSLDYMPNEEDQTRLSRLCRRDFKQALAKGRNTHTAGKRNIRLSNLFVHPSYHRRGIGGQLIQQGIDLADTKGYISFLEASPMGKALYARYGYREIDSFTLDLSKYRIQMCSEPELYTTSIIIREPR